MRRVLRRSGGRQALLIRGCQLLLCAEGAPLAGRFLGPALDDYEHVGVSDIGGTDESGYWLCVTDQRLGLAYEISSHADYWDFLGYFADGKPWPVKPVLSACVSPGVADNGPGERQLSSTRRREQFPSRGCRDGAPGPGADPHEATAMTRRSDWSSALLAWCDRAEPDTRELDLLSLGARVTLDLFCENHRPRGDLRRWSVMHRAEEAQRSRVLKVLKAKEVS